MLLCTAAAVLYPTIRTLLIARRTSPQALYTTPSFVRTFGTFYIHFRQQRYYFFVVLLAAAVLKSLFISFAKGSGLAQVIALLIIEIAVLVALCIQKPYRSRGGDALAVYLAITRVVAAMLMVPFVESLGVQPIPRVAIGFVLIVLFSIAVIVMCVNVTFNFGNGLLWRRHANTQLSSSGGTSMDIEKAGMGVFSSAPSIPPMASALRPTNPTPSTSFSHVASTHSRHTPKMSAAVSPDYTIPSFCTSEEEDEGEGGDGEDIRRHSTQSQGSSFFTASSPPLTSQVDQFSSPLNHTPEIRSEDHDTSS